jgi:hypothetical protein
LVFGGAVFGGFVLDGFGGFGVFVLGNTVFEGFLGFFGTAVDGHGVVESVRLFLVGGAEGLRVRCGVVVGEVFEFGVIEFLGFYISLGILKG